MDIRVLKYFVQVAKDRNFTRASEHLYISQPALSKTIKKLEHELGINLFDIRTTGVQLTDYGQMLYQRAVPLIAEFDALTNFVSDIQAKPVGRLRVGVTPMIATLYTVRFVTEFNERWPDVELQITENGSIALRKQLLDGELDLILCITGDSADGLHETILFEDEMVAVVSGNNPLSQCSSLRFEQLEDQTFNLYSRYATLTRQIEERCIKAGFMPKVNISSSKVNFMLQMTEHNRGICILPRPYAMRGLRDNLKVVSFADPFPWQGCLVRNQNNYRTYLSKLFEQFVIQYFKSYKTNSRLSFE